MPGDDDLWQQMLQKMKKVDKANAGKSVFAQDLEILPAAPKAKWISAGCVVFLTAEDTSKVLLIHPAGNFGPWAFPKGRIDEGETKVQAAIREVWEETGVNVRLIPKGYLGPATGSHSITHYYLAYRVGGSPKTSKETDKVGFVPVERAFELFKRSGNKRDPDVLQRALQRMNALKEPLG